MDAVLYSEAMSIREAKEAKMGVKIEPRKNRYEGELHQHSKAAEFEVAAGVDTKERVNAWLKRGKWFEFVEGRLPTEEDKAGVDIEKYLIK